MGRNIYSKKFTNAKEITLELDGQEMGLYFLEIYSGGQILAKRKVVLE